MKNRRKAPLPPKVILEPPRPTVIPEEKEASPKNRKERNSVNESNEQSCNGVLPSGGAQRVANEEHPQQRLLKDVRPPSPCSSASSHSNESNAGAPSSVVSDRSQVISDKFIDVRSVNDPEASKVVASSLAESSKTSSTSKPAEGNVENFENRSGIGSIYLFLLY